MKQRNPGICSVGTGWGFYLDSQARRTSGVHRHLREGEPASLDEPRQQVFYPREPRPFQRLVSKVRRHWLQEKLMSPRMEGQRVRVPGNDTTGHTGQMREFLRAVASGSAETALAVDARRDLEIILRAYDSMNSGRPLPLETRQPVAVQNCEALCSARPLAHAD